jgi:hypothetical protein
MENKIEEKRTVSIKKTIKKNDGEKFDITVDLEEDLTGKIVYENYEICYSKPIGWWKYISGMTKQDVIELRNKLNKLEL